VGEEVEFKARSADFRIESDPRRAFRPTFRGTGMSDDWDGTSAKCNSVRKAYANLSDNLVALACASKYL